ncbi:hypothetical protein M6B38_264430 [Iris pallida]|uniref:Uncharacterized protein n=1 Tax=Iris pallida TaxID=29817 RepID=A0AAX6IB34_IRIPA|nr:hypothetical protein M6B38_264430 [Iris pallida]
MKSYKECKIIERVRTLKERELQDDVKSEFRTQDYVWLYEFDARCMVEWT